MSKQKFFKSYANVPPKYEKTVKKGSLVDPSLNVPTKVRIENMIAAGERLEAHRKEMYDLTDGYTKNLDLPIDRLRNTDMGEVLEAGKAAQKRLSDAYKEVTARNAEENERKIYEKVKAQQDALETPEKPEKLPEE